MKIKLLLSFLILCLLPSISFAGCTRADACTWKIYGLIFGSVGRCMLYVPRSGQSISSNSNCVIPGSSAFSLTGDFSITKDCHFTGLISIAGNRFIVDAFISKDKGNISGMAWTPGNGASGFIFSGVK